MKAVKTSHTVLLAKPASAQLIAAFVALNPGLASSAGLNSAHFERTATIVAPIKPTAGHGSGSNTSPAMTPAKIEKKYHACCGRPPGAGINATMITMANGVSDAMRELAELGISILQRERSQNAFY